MFAGAYGFAHFGKSLLWHASELFFAFFLTETCGLTGAQMGQILGVSLVVNALADFAVGKALNRRVRSTRSASGVQLVGAILSGLAFVAVALAGHVGAEQRYAYAFCAVLGFRIAYAVVDTPQNTILAFATRTDVERSRLSSIRYIFGGLAKVGLAIAFAPLLQGQPVAIQATRFAAIAVVLAAVSMASAVILQRLARRAASPTEPAERDRDAGTARSGGYLSLFLMVVATAIGFSVFTKLEPYFATFMLQSRLQGGVMMAGVALGSVVSQPLWADLTRRFGLAGVLRMAAAVLLVGLCLLAISPGLGVVLVGVSSLLFGAGMGGVHMAQWALLASISSAPGSRLSGTAAFGLFTACSKLGKAAAVFGLGILLDRADYRDGGASFVPVMLAMMVLPVVATALAIGLSLRFRGEPQPA